jgi:hypothetical protein
MRKRSLYLVACLFLPTAWSMNPVMQQDPHAAGTFDAQVGKFLDSRRGTWNDLNVPEADGQKLHDIIVEHKYKSALEIGTSTGHSGIWIACALARLGTPRLSRRTACPGCLGLRSWPVFHAGRLFQVYFPAEFRCDMILYDLSFSAEL